MPDEELDFLIKEIQDPLYFKAWKKNKIKIEQISHLINNKFDQTSIDIIKNQIPKLIESVRIRNTSFRTLYKLIETCRIDFILELYSVLEASILSLVKQNKYTSFWFMILLLRVKNKLDGNTHSLESICLDRYLSPNKNNIIVSKFLTHYLNEIEFFNRQLLFKHCIKYKSYKDSYGRGILDVFLDIFPEYRKFAVLV